MRYTHEIVIDLPRARVIELFDNPENMKQWQPGLESFEHLSGTPGQPGAKSRLIYKAGNREMEMIETVTVRNLPDEFSGTYEMKGGLSVVKNRFTALDAHRTKWDVENESQFSGMLKLMTWIMPGVFKKQSRELLEQFKAFAEKQGN